MLFSKPTPYIEYIPPRLTEGKEWYISYYAQSPDTKKLKRVKIKLNRVKLITHRRIIARQLIADITAKLICGWNPFIENESPKAYNRLFDVFDIFLKIKKKDNEENSTRTYDSFIKTIKNWLISQGYDEAMYVCNFTIEVATEFMLSVNSSDKISPRTYNNYLLFYRGVWAWMAEQNYISKNPFEKLKRKPKKMTAKKRRTLTDVERKDLQVYLEANNKEYFAMCLLCYYCLLRPHEITMLRVGDFKLKEQVILISEDIAKNDKNSVRTIPDVMMPYLINLNWNSPKDYYLFAENGVYEFRPGKKQLCSRKLAKYWQNHIRPALGWGMELQFYSLKDTGITNMIASGIPLTYVQGQADHSSIAMTAIYTEKMNNKAMDELKKVDTF